MIGSPRLEVQLIRRFVEYQGSGFEMICEGVFIKAMGIVLGFVKLICKTHVDSARAALGLSPQADFDQ